MAGRWTDMGPTGMLPEGHGADPDIGAGLCLPANPVFLLVTRTRFDQASGFGIPCRDSENCWKDCPPIPVSDSLDGLV